MIDQDREARLAQLRAQIADVRARADAAPLGRYRAGQEAARDTLDRDAARRIIADVADGITLTQVLAAVVKGDEETARDLLAQLAERDGDLVSSLQVQAARVAELAEQAGRGVR